MGVLNNLNFYAICQSACTKKKFSLGNPTHCSPRVPRNTKKSLTQHPPSLTGCTPPHTHPRPSFSTGCQTSQPPKRYLSSNQSLHVFPSPRDLLSPFGPRRGSNQPGRDSGRPQASRSPGTAGQARRWARAGGARVR